MENQFQTSAAQQLYVQHKWQEYKQNGSVSVFRSDVVGVIKPLWVAFFFQAFSFGAIIICATKFSQEFEYAIPLGLIGLLIAGFGLRGTFRSVTLLDRALCIADSDFAEKTRQQATKTGQ